jgi:hypothetical protein
MRPYDNGPCRGVGRKTVPESSLVAGRRSDSPGRHRKVMQAGGGLERAETRVSSHAHTRARTREAGLGKGVAPA